MKLRDLFEAPISDVSLVGDWEKNSSFNAQNRKLLTNPKAVNKIKTLWKFPEEAMFNIICVNSADARKHTEVGIVDIDWLEKNMPRDFPELTKVLNHDQCNVIFTNNKGDQGVPMTGWIMAHRLGHALQASTGGWRADTVRNHSGSYYFKEAVQEFERIMFDVMKEYRIPSADRGYGSRSLPFNGGLRGFLHAVGTFRSARERSIRNPFEFILECFAQFILTGKVKFNDVPRSFRYGREYYHVGSEDDQQHIQNQMEHLMYMLEQYFEQTLGSLEGTILVM